MDNDLEVPDINCNYVDINSFNYKNKKNTFSLFHLNIASLKKNKDELETFLNMIDFKFDFMGITETKLKATSDPIFNINIDCSKCFSTPSEGGGHFFILRISLISLISLTKLNKIMYQSNMLDSIFVEICNKKNVIIVCIYRNPSMGLNEYNDDFFNPLLENIATDRKLYLVGYLNIYLLKVDIESPTTIFFILLQQTF